MTDPRFHRASFRNIHLLRDLPSYLRAMPPSAYVSILHRASGVLLFFLLPAIGWVFDMSVTSEQSFAELRQAYTSGFGWLPMEALNALVLVLIWGFLHHLLAGLRHLFMDLDHEALEKRRAMVSAWAVLALSLAVTCLVGGKLFSLY